MKTMWENIPCDYVVKKVEEVGWTVIIHNYDFGLFDFDEAMSRFSKFSFEATKLINKVKEGTIVGTGFTGGQCDQLNFHAIREGGKVHITMNEKKYVYKKIRSKMI